mmetsp:Transcript_12301/g.39198  ORF Transcript_12301/g.39198 Transcript_12301/m.39198 type:complete len:93 (+) Transcript_12301:242-520(+)
MSERPGWFDFQVGSLLSVLDDELGLRDQTFLLLSADHGPERPWPSGPTDAELNNMGRTAPGASGDKHTLLLEGARGCSSAPHCWTRSTINDL